jgi:hypothetical protein
MPGLRLHLTIARDLATEIDDAAVDADRGAYYLGATTPDIRAITRWDRQKTHFFDLADFEPQDGVHRLFEQEAALRDAGKLDSATRAFMLGYISHLVMDEDYITEIYRPLFGERSPLHANERADVMDKMLQWDIERADCDAEPAKMDEIRRALAESAVEVNIDFIARDTLLQWRDISLDVMAQTPSPERLVRFLSRRIPHARIESEADVARLVEEVPVLLKQTWEHVGEERVREFLHDARAHARTRMKEYLS